MSPKRHLVILNPTADRGNAIKRIPVIKELMDSYKLDYEIIQTNAQLHAIELAKQAVRDGFDAVISASGDGTANEVINGLMEMKAEKDHNVQLGVFPIGTGNDFAFGADIPEKLEDAIKNVAEGKAKAVDIGFVKGGDFPEGRYFGNCIGVGFDAEAGFVAAGLAPLRGFLSYIVAAILTAFIYFKAPTLEIEYNGKKIVKPSLMCSIMTGTRLGGGFFMAPDAKNDDGLYDVCIVDEVSSMKILGLIPSFFKGTQESHDEVEMIQAKKLKVTALKGKISAHVDGETLCENGKSVEVELIPKALEILCEC